MSLEKDALQAAMARAIVDSVTPEVQREVFQKAILTHLFEPFKKSAYSEERTTQLSELFSKAISDAVNTVARSVIAEPENIARIEAAIREAFEVAAVHKAIVDKVTDRVTHAFANW